MGHVSTQESIPVLQPCPRAEYELVVDGAWPCVGNDCCLLFQKNITRAHQVSKKPPKPVVKVIRISTPTQDAVHNYSVQTMNSTALAKKELYRETAKVSERHRVGNSQMFILQTAVG